MSPWDHCNGDRDHDQPGQILGFQPAEINRPLIFPGGGWGVSTSTGQYGWNGGSSVGRLKKIPVLPS